MKMTCPVCDSPSGIETLNKVEEFTIKGEKINVPIKLFHCTECDSSFASGELGDPFKEAYKAYRNLKKMIHPEEIINFRKKYDLTQKELSNLLGFGEVSLSRYENGSLQDETHDTLLKLVMDPTNLLELIETKVTAINEKKRVFLISKLENELSTAKFLLDFFAPDHPNEYNGYKVLDLTKVGEAIKSFCYNRQVFKTKLLKLLFYSDFLNFKVAGNSITGLKYAHLPLGPVPHEYEFILGALKNIDTTIEYELVEFPKFSGEIVKVNCPPNITVFSKKEIEIINFVNEKFQDLTATQLSKQSHDEHAYTQTSKGEIISYNYAKQLHLDIVI